MVCLWLQSDRLWCLRSLYHQCSSSKHALLLMASYLIVSSTSTMRHSFIFVTRVFRHLLSSKSTVRTGNTCKAFHCVTYSAGRRIIQPIPSKAWLICVGRLLSPSIQNVLLYLHDILNQAFNTIGHWNTRGAFDIVDNNDAAVGRKDGYSWGRM